MAAAAASSSAVGERKLPIFNGEDFPVWKMVVQQYLEARNLSKFLTALPDIKNENEVLQDKIVLSYITRSLDVKQARQVLGCKTASSAWAKLGQMNEMSSEASITGKTTEFMATSM